MRRKRTLFLLASLVVATLTFALEQRYHLLSRAYQDTILDNKTHSLACEQLPSVETIDATIFEHAGTIEEVIHKVAANYRETEIAPYWDREARSIQDQPQDFYISMHWGEARDRGCKNGRGDIIITYISHQDRKIIEDSFGKTFFGIPYRLMNV